MRIKLALAALAATAAFSLPAAAQTAPKVQVGVLRCAVAPYTGLVLGSVREMTCEFLQGTSNTVLATYKGTARRLGVDLGVGGAGVLGWTVFAPSTSKAAVDLSGHYAGVSADVAVGVGGGANVLLGGSNSTIALQPVSIQGSTGLNVAAGLADLTLTPVPAATAKGKKVTK
ncbi:DUF992 domain-containing protein [Aquabacter cavernae]|uniref:DUF992 domain-containing protein n=1 Tax=Aquabacter cavernae TaxID=2496029 RepID=UPI000F8DF13F|nr:DUF992 domain-containing protein [Aquabacter cavernae]